MSVSRYLRFLFMALLDDAMGRLIHASLGSLDALSPLLSFFFLEPNIAAAEVGQSFWQRDQFGFKLNSWRSADSVARTPWG